MPFDVSGPYSVIGQRAADYQLGKSNAIDPLRFSSDKVEGQAKNPRIRSDAFWHKAQPRTKEAA